MSTGHDPQRADVMLPEAEQLTEVLAAAIVFLAATPHRSWHARRKLAAAVEAAAPGIVARTREELR